MNAAHDPKPILRLDDWFARDLPGLHEPWKAATVAAPELLVLNDDLATEIGADPEALRAPEGVAVLVGNVVPEGATPIAMGYAGHQFGGYSPRLGDGRALLLGEVTDSQGRVRDVHLKGSGVTPFARGGDGKAAVGPMLREYLIAEALEALHVPTTRALAVVATGEQVVREKLLPGAVLARVAASHVRVGTFEYAARLEDPTVLKQLADHVIARHFPHTAKSDEPYLALFRAVVDVQASLVAQWMMLGFIHGVMNTDNMTVSGESIDFGPCAFMDRFDPATVYSSIDRAGRYAYGNQPPIAQWNLTRLAETLLSLIDPDGTAAAKKATAVLEEFPGLFKEYWASGMRAKLGIEDEQPDDLALFDDYLALLQSNRVDYTKSFRALSSDLRGDNEPLHALFGDGDAISEWTKRWRTRLEKNAQELAAVASAMDLVNPVYVPRNHLVEAALNAGSAGDLSLFFEMLDVVTHPYEERAGFERFAQPAPEDFNAKYQTFCGT